MSEIELAAHVWTALEYLESISGPGAIAEIVADFAHDAPSRLVRMQVALETGSWQALSRLAHDLKSNSATLGVLQLSVLAAKIELTAQDGWKANLAPMLQEAESILPQVLTALEKRARHYPA